MGTRSVTWVYETNLEPVLALYGQYDGYPQGVGSKIAEFLKPLKLVNGFGLNPVNEANGMGCLAAQLVAAFKQKVGGYYIVSPAGNNYGQDYEYHIYSDRVIVKNWDQQVIFQGTWSQFSDFCYDDDQ